jgi:hypothetical protein
MIRKLLEIFFILIFFYTNVNSQDITVNVTEQTFELRSHEALNIFFQFAEGDQILINLYEIKDKKLSEFSITEYP